MAKGDKDRELIRLQQILYAALAEPIGLVIRTSDVHRARQRLYEARMRAGDPILSRLQFRFAPWGKSELLITKGLLKESFFESLAEEEFPSD